MNETLAHSRTSGGFRTTSRHRPSKIQPSRIQPIEQKFNWPFLAFWLTYFTAILSLGYAIL